MSKDPLYVGEVEEVMDRAVGRKITDYELNSEGLHLFLEDGGCLLFVGQFAVAAVPPTRGHH